MANAVRPAIAGVHNGFRQTVGGEGRLVRRAREPFGAARSKSQLKGGFESNHPGSEILDMTLLFGDRCSKLFDFISQLDGTGKRIPDTLGEAHYECFLRG